MILILWQRKRKEPFLGYFSVNENRFEVYTIKKRLKSILPTLKEKKRYLAFEIVSKSKINDFKDVSEQIMAKSLELVGQLGVAKAGIQVLSDCWNPELQRGIIRVGNKHVDELKSSLTFVEKIDNKEVIVKSIGISGILDKAKERYLKWDMKIMLWDSNQADWMS